MLLHQLLNNYKLNINFSRGGGVDFFDDGHTDLIPIEEEEAYSYSPQIALETFNLLNHDQQNEILIQYLNYLWGNQLQLSYFKEGTEIQITDSNQLHGLLFQQSEFYIAYSDEKFERFKIYKNFGQFLYQFQNQAYFWDLYPIPKFHGSRIQTLDKVSQDLSEQLDLSNNQDLQDIQQTLAQLQDPEAIKVLTPETQCTVDNGDKKYYLNPGQTSFKVVPEIYNDEEEETDEQLAKRIYFQSRDEIARFQADFIEACKLQEDRLKKDPAHGEPSKFYVTRGVMVDYQDDHPNNKKHAEIYFMYNSKRKECHQYVRQFNKNAESLFVQYSKHQHPSISSDEDTTPSQIHNAITFSCIDVCKVTITDDLSQKLRKITVESNSDKNTKKRITENLDLIPPTPLGITVKRESGDDSTITVTRKTTEGNEDVYNSEYIEVQDEVFKKLSPTQQQAYSSGKIKRFFIRVHFKDNGTSESEIDTENVYYFDENGVKRRVPLSRLREDPNFQQYQSTYLNSYGVNAEEHFKTQFQKTKARIHTRQITQMKNGLITTTITESQNEKEKKQLPKAGKTDLSFREPESESCELSSAIQKTADPAAEPVAASRDPSRAADRDAAGIRSPAGGTSWAAGGGEGFGGGGAVGWAGAEAAGLSGGGDWAADRGADIYAAPAADLGGGGGYGGVGVGALDAAGRGSRDLDLALAKGKSAVKAAKVAASKALAAGRAANTGLPAAAVEDQADAAVTAAKESAVAAKEAVKAADIALKLVAAAGGDAVLAEKAVEAARRAADAAIHEVKVAKTFGDLAAGKPETVSPSVAGGLDLTNDRNLPRHRNQAAFRAAESATESALAASEAFELVAALVPGRDAAPAAAPAATARRAAGRAGAGGGDSRRAAGGAGGGGWAAALEDVLAEHVDTVALARKVLADAEAAGRAAAEAEAARRAEAEAEAELAYRALAEAEAEFARRALDEAEAQAALRALFKDAAEGRGWDKDKGNEAQKVCAKAIEERFAAEERLNAARSRAEDLRRDLFAFRTKEAETSIAAGIGGGGGYGGVGAVDAAEGFGGAGAPAPALVAGEGRAPAVAAGRGGVGGYGVGGGYGEGGGGRGRLDGGRPQPWVSALAGGRGEAGAEPAGYEGDLEENSGGGYDRGLGGGWTGAGAGAGAAAEAPVRGQGPAQGNGAGNETFGRRSPPPGKIRGKDQERKSFAHQDQRRRRGRGKSNNSLLEDSKSGYESGTGSDVSQASFQRSPPATPYLGFSDHDAQLSSFTASAFAGDHNPNLSKPLSRRLATTYPSGSAYASAPASDHARHGSNQETWRYRVVTSTPDTKGTYRLVR